MNALIFSGTGPVNAAYSVGPLDVGAYDNILVILRAIGGTFAAVANTLFMIDSTGSAVQLVGSTLTLAQALALSHFGPDIAAALNGGIIFPGAIPRKIRYDVAALGAGVQAQVIVVGRLRGRGDVT